MLTFLGILEDTLIKANFDIGSGMWSGVAVDCMTGKRHEFALTSEQMGAVLALAYGGEDYPEELTAQLYKIAGPAVADFPQECRPIP